MEKAAYYPAAVRRDEVRALQAGAEPWWLVGGVLMGLGLGWLVWSSGAARFREGLR